HAFQIAGARAARQRVERGVMVTACIMFRGGTQGGVRQDFLHHWVQGAARKQRPSRRDTRSGLVQTWSLRLKIPVLLSCSTVLRRTLPGGDVPQRAVCALGVVLDLPGFDDSP